MPEDLDKETETSAKDAAPKAAAETSAKPGKHAQVWQWVLDHKKISVPAAIVLVLAVLAAVPLTRYALAGLVVKQDYAVQVLDAETHKPVTSAQVNLHGVATNTDNQGRATLHVPVGGATLAITKQYYKSASAHVLVPLGGAKALHQISLQATGRQVPVKVINIITGAPLENAQVSAAGTQARTDKNGEATMVLPANESTQKGTVSADGYNGRDIVIAVTAAVDPANTFTITPAGKVYFLSNLTGKIDVVKTNLDGTDRKVVLAGTGKEIPGQTTLLASTDWKYLALSSKRDGGDHAKLFLIDTSNDQLITMDEGDAEFTISGWSGHDFIYQVNRTKVQTWQPKQQAIKSYDADKKAINVLDETTAAGTSSTDYVREYYVGGIFILKDEVVYLKGWDMSGNNAYQLASKPVSLASVKTDGSGRKTIQNFGDAQHFYVGQIRAYKAYGLYISVDQYGPTNTEKFYAYQDGKLAEDTSITQDTFYQNYNTYLSSPSGKQTFWSELRDGKNTLFVGDDDGSNGKQVASDSKYQTYGWFTDDYLFISKDASELYVLPASGLAGNAQPLKVTNYYKPDVSFRGYGGGYGGL